MEKKTEQWLACHFMLLSFLIYEIQEKKYVKKKKQLFLDYFLVFQVTL